MDEGTEQPGLPDMQKRGGGGLIKKKSVLRKKNRDWFYAAWLHTVR